jgi:hypothetical protein
MNITTNEAQLIHAFMVYMADVDGLTEQAKKVWIDLYNKLEKDWHGWDTDKFKVWKE